MDKEQFIQLLSQADLEGLVFNNTRKTPLTILGTNKDRIHYQRGKSTVSIKYSQLFKAWDAFKGSTVTCQQLQEWKPGVFDSKGHPKPGHDSNSGMFLMLMEHLELATDVNRDGHLYSAILLTKKIN